MSTFLRRPTFNFNGSHNVKSEIPIEPSAKSEGQKRDLVKFSTNISSQKWNFYQNEDENIWIFEIAAILNKTDEKT